MGKIVKNRFHFISNLNCAQKLEFLCKSENSPDPKKIKHFITYNESVISKREGSGTPN